MGAEGHQVRWPNQLTSLSATELFGQFRRAIAEPTGAGIAEAVLGVVVISVIGVLVPGHWGLLGIQPHPLWIVVIAIALRYGIVPGYIAGALAALSYTLFLCFRPGQGVHLPGTSEWIQPLFLLVGGVLVGELVRAHHQDLTTLQEQNVRMRETLLDVLNERQTLAETHAEHKQRAGDQSTSPHTFFELAQKVNTLNAESVYPAVLDIVSDALQAEACAIYLWRDDQLNLHLGLPEVYPGRPDALDTHSGLVGMAFREGRTISIRDGLFTAGPHAITDELTMLAGPLKDREGHVFGIVTVERLPFLKLNAANIRLFDALLEWSSTAIANAREYEALREHRTEPEREGTDEGSVTYALSATETMTRLRDEFAHARIEQRLLSLLAIQIEQYPPEAPHLAHAFLGVLGMAVERCMRQIDTFGLLDQSDVYVLLLPDMSLDGARVVAQCIHAELSVMQRHVECPLTVCVGAATLGDQASPEQMLAQALPEAPLNASPVPVGAS